MRLLSLSILTLLYILSSVHSAEAHRPYLVKDKTFETPKGIIITERLYGDGIVVTDPMQYQIRDGKGNVLANTKTYNHIATFCPNLKFCWAFPYDGFTILSVGQKLDYKGLDLEKEKPIFELAEEEKTSFERYLSDPNYKRTASYEFGYPEFQNKDKIGFKAVKFSSVFSALVILKENLIGLLLTLALSIVPIFIKSFFFDILKSESRIITFARKLFGTVLIIGFTIFFIITIFSLSFFTGIPFFYMMVSLSVGLYIGSKMGKRIVQKHNAI